MRVLSAAIVVASVACAGSPPEPPRPAPIALGPQDAAPSAVTAADAASERLPLHDAAVSYLGDDGRWLGQDFAPEQDLSALARGCYERAIRGDRALQGWVRAELTMQNGPALVGAVESSSGLPAELVKCLTSAMATLTPQAGGPSLVRTHVYVSLRITEDDAGTAAR